MYKQITITRCVPNAWNPNAMSPSKLAKLEESLKATLAQSATIPPIVVRKIGSGEERKYEIIDGYHRWKVLKKLGHKKIDAFILKVDDVTAKKLTVNLNYLRGEYDPKKYVSILDDLLSAGNSIDSLAKELPETDQELQDLIDTYGSEDTQWKAFKEASKEFDEEARKAAASDDNIFVELRFSVSKPQADIILKELHRIGDTLQGNNVEGRALEFMAVNSTRVPTRKENAEEILDRPKKKKKKAA